MKTDPLFGLYRLPEWAETEALRNSVLTQGREGGRHRYHLLGEKTLLPAYTEQFPNSHLGRHEHDFFEIILILGGLGLYLVGEETFQVGEGSVIFTMPGIPHQLITHQGPLKRLSVGFQPGVVSDLPAAILKQDPVLAVFFERTQKRPLKISEPLVFKKILAPFFQLAELAGLKAEIPRGLLGSQFKAALSHLTFHMAQKVPNDKTDGLLQKVRSYILSHLDEKISVGRMARAMGQEARAFSKKFRTATGFGFNDYLHLLRISQAQKLLGETALPVTQIMLSTGFNNATYFNKYFKRCTGRTPRVYRRLASLQKV